MNFDGKSKSAFWKHARNFSYAINLNETEYIALFFSYREDLWSGFGKLNIQKVHSQTKTEKTCCFLLDTTSMLKYSTKFFLNLPSATFGLLVSEVMH